MGVLLYPQALTKPRADMMACARKYYIPVDNIQRYG
jgi:hypothetical protein